MVTFLSSLVLPQNVDDLCAQVTDSHLLALGTSLVGQDMDVALDMVPVLPPMFGNVCDG
jgi:hypothetical protein